MLDTIADNFGTYAGDGLGDDWQVQYFGLSNPNAAPLLDPDFDGHNNRNGRNEVLLRRDREAVTTWDRESVTRRAGHRPALPGTEPISQNDPLITALSSGTGKSVAGK